MEETVPAPTESPEEKAKAEEESEKEPKEAEKEQEKAEKEAEKEQKEAEKEQEKAEKEAEKEQKEAEKEQAPEEAEGGEPSGGVGPGSALREKAADGGRDPLGPLRDRRPPRVRAGCRTSTRRPT